MTVDNSYKQDDLRKKFIAQDKRPVITPIGSGEMERVLPTYVLREQGDDKSIFDDASISIDIEEQANITDGSLRLCIDRAFFDTGNDLINQAVICYGSFQQLEEVVSYHIDRIEVLDEPLPDNIVLGCKVLLERQGFSAPSIDAVRSILNENNSTAKELRGYLRSYNELFDPEKSIMDTFDKEFVLDYMVMHFLGSKRFNHYSGWPCAGESSDLKADFHQEMQAACKQAGWSVLECKSVS